MPGAKIAVEFYAGYNHDTMYERSSPGTWLYLFRNPQNSSTKIGISVDYENRRQGLSSSGGVKLRAVFAIFFAIFAIFFGACRVMIFTIIEKQCNLVISINKSKNDRKWNN